MSRATTVTYPADWSMYDANQAVGDGQPLSIITVPMSGNVRVGPVITNETALFSGFNASDFTAGGAAEVIIDAAELNGIQPQFNVWLTTSTATSTTQSGAGISSQYYWSASPSGLNGVDPTDPTFVVHVQPTSVSEITSINATSAVPAAPTNDIVPVASIDVSAGTITTTNGLWGAFPAPTISYLWSTGETTQTVNLGPSDAGVPISCIVTATNALGSASETTASFGPYAAPAFTAAITPAGSMSQRNQSVSPIISPVGTPVFAETTSYVWNDSTTASSHTTNWATQFGTTLTVNVTRTNVFGSTTVPATFQIPNAAKYTTASSFLSRQYQPSLPPENSTWGSIVLGSIGGSTLANAAPAPGYMYSAEGLWNLTPVAIPIPTGKTFIGSEIQTNYTSSTSAAGTEVYNVRLMLNQNYTTEFLTEASGNLAASGTLDFTAAALTNAASINANASTLTLSFTLIAVNTPPLVTMTNVVWLYYI